MTPGTPVPALAQVPALNNLLWARPSLSPQLGRARAEHHGKADRDRTGTQQREGCRAGFGEPREEPSWQIAGYTCQAGLSQWWALQGQSWWVWGLKRRWRAVPGGGSCWLKEAGSRAQDPWGLQEGRGPVEARGRSERAAEGLDTGKMASGTPASPGVRQECPEGSRCAQEGQHCGWGGGDGGALRAPELRRGPQVQTVRPAKAEGPPRQLGHSTAAHL